MKKKYNHLVLEEGEITILINRDDVLIEISDGKSRLDIIKLTMNHKNFCKALSREANNPCKIELYDNKGYLNRKMEVDKISFPMPIDSEFDSLENREKIAYEQALKFCPEGWEPDDYFSSKDSFFYIGEYFYGKAIIRRWVKEGI